MHERNASRPEAWGRAGIAVLGLLAFGCAGLPGLRAQGFDLYIVRHAETWANVTGDYSAQNQRRFSERGEREIEELAGALEPLHLDAVLVSPTVRTLRTVAPYLRRAGVTAEIWPELEECCWQADRELPPSAGRTPREPIELDPELAPLFRFRSERARFWYRARTHAESLRQVDQGLALLLERYSHSGKAVLIVSHFHTGARILAGLLGDPPVQAIALRTAAITHVRQEPGGGFRLVTLNGAPTGDEPARAGPDPPGPRQARPEPPR